MKKNVLLPLVLAFTAVLLLAGWTAGPRTSAAPAAPGDPIPAITCTDPNYIATVYAEGLSGPDALAFSPAGVLHVSEEPAGRISSVATDGTVTPVLSGLTQPEGIAFDSAGNLYVVEDVSAGRLIQRTPLGTMNVLTDSLIYPEGVTAGPNGHVYVTESDAETVFNNPSQETVENARSYVNRVAVTAPYTFTRLVTAEPDINFPAFDEVDVNFFSLADLTFGADGMVYVTNELSGREAVTTTEVSSPFGPIEVTITFSSTESVFPINPSVPMLTFPAPHAIDLITPEGNRFHTGGQFPLFVAEEDHDEAGNGRLMVVAADGSKSMFCEGFGTIEDVIVDSDGVIYVTEDSTGRIVRIAGDNCATTAPTDAVITETAGTVDISWTAVGVGDFVRYLPAAYAPNSFSCPADAACELAAGSYTDGAHTADDQAYYAVTAVDACGATAAVQVGRYRFPITPGD